MLFSLNEIYCTFSIKLLEESLHLAADISSAQRVVGIGEDAVEVNDLVGLRVDDGRVECVTCLVTCGVALGLVKDCSYDVAHKLFQLFLVIEFIAFDIAISMYDNAIAMPRGLNQLGKCFGHFKAWNVGGFEVRETVDPFRDGCSLTFVVGCNRVGEGVPVGCYDFGDQLFRTNYQL